jgi:hypothetical protein
VGISSCCVHHSNSCSCQDPTHSASSTGLGQQSLLGPSDLGLLTVAVFWIFNISSWLFLTFPDLWVPFPAWGWDFVTVFKADKI